MISVSGYNKVFIQNVKNRMAQRLSSFIYCGRVVQWLCTWTFVQASRDRFPASTEKMNKILNL